LVDLSGEGPEGRAWKFTPLLIRANPYSQASCCTMGTIGTFLPVIFFLRGRLREINLSPTGRAKCTPNARPFLSIPQPDMVVAIWGIALK
jgi:hypothetical protein